MYMTYYGASYLPPTSKSATFESTSFNRGNEALTYQTALNNFLAYPSAQGTEDLKITNISGLTTLTNNLVIDGSGNYIQFPDATQQTTAFVQANYALLNVDNVFLAPYIQTFQGQSAPNGTNAPFRIGGNNGEYISLYIDPSTSLDATLYSAQTAGGLTIRNSGGNSFTMTPTGANNTAYFSNPISCGTQTLTCGNIFSGSINCSNITSTGISTGVGTISGGAISGSQLTLSGQLNSGTINSGAITSSGNLSCSSITSTQISTGAGSISGGTISGTQLTLSTSGSISGNSIITINQLPSYYSTALNTSTSYHINDGNFQYNISFSSSNQKIFTPTGTNISIVPNANYPTNTLTITFTTPLSITGTISYPAIIVYMDLYNSYVYDWSGILTSTTLVLTYSGASTIPSDLFIINPQTFGFSIL